MARDEPFVTPSPLVVVVKGCGGPSALAGPPPLFQGSRWNVSVILRAVPFDIFPFRVFALEGLEVARWRKAAGFAIVPEGRLRAGECLAGLDSLLTLSPTSRANRLIGHILRLPDATAPRDCVPLLAPTTLVTTTPSVPPSKAPTGPPTIAPSTAPVAPPANFFPNVIVLRDFLVDFIVLFQISISGEPREPVAAPDSPAWEPHSTPVAEPHSTAGVEEDWPDEGLDPNQDEAPGQVAALDHPAACVMVHADHNGW